MLRDNSIGSKSLWLGEREYFDTEKATVLSAFTEKVQRLHFPLSESLTFFVQKATSAAGNIAWLATLTDLNTHFCCSLETFIKLAIKA